MTDTCLCTACNADLTLPHSVSRQYVSKDDDEPVYAEGHYATDGHFESDEFAGFDGGNFDLLDDSDSCVACEAKI